MHAGVAEELMAEVAVTAFGQYLIEKMAEHDPPLSRPELAERMGISPSTISRWITKSNKPDTENLALLADALGLDYGEVLVRAGHGKPADEVTDAPRPLRTANLREADAMLHPDSPLSDRDRERIDTLIGVTIEPYRRLMKRRRAS
jgi:transcriptional regulator with XRE-family HTH domain